MIGDGGGWDGGGGGRGIQCICKKSKNQSKYNSLPFHEVCHMFLQYFIEFPAIFMPRAVSRMSQMRRNKVE